MEDKGWVDFFVPPMFSSDGSKMALILPQNQGAEGDFRHAVLAEKRGTASEYIVRPLTKGKYTVTDILFYDDVKNLVWVLISYAQKLRPRIFGKRPQPIDSLSYRTQVLFGNDGRSPRTTSPICCTHRRKQPRSRVFVVQGKNRTPEQALPL